MHPSAHLDLYLLPDRCFFRNEKKSHNAKSGLYGGCGNTLNSSDFKNQTTVDDLWAGVLLYNKRACCPVLGRIFVYFVRNFLRTTFLQKLQDTLISLRTATALLVLIGSLFRKKIAYNSFFTMTVRLAILGLFG